MVVVNTGPAKRYYKIGKLEDVKQSEEKKRVRERERGTGRA